MRPAAGRRAVLRAAVAAVALAPPLRLGAAGAQARAPAIGFERGQTRGGSAAPTGRARLLVLDFLDPRRADLGQAIAAMVQKEILAGLGDVQQGAAILPVLAGPARQRLAEQLERDLHRGALRLAVEHQARAVVWGRVEPLGDMLTLHASVSLFSAVEDPDLVQQLVIDGTRVPDLSTELGWTRFDFPPFAARRLQIFDRTLLVGSAGLELRVAPEASGPPTRVAVPGELLRIRDMQGSWYVVAEGAGALFADAAPRRDLAAGSQLLPRRAAVLAGELARPAPNPRLPATIPADGQRFHRLGAPRAIDGQPWFQVDLGGQRGWLAQRQLAAIPDLPAAHFAVALQRVIAGDAEGAEREFGRFLQRPDTDRSHVITAAALQFMAVSKLRGETTTRAQREAALGLLDRAVAATPRDPAVLALRALVRLGHADALGALADLEAALVIDSQNGRARLLLSAFRRAGEQGALPWLAGEEFRTRLEQALQRLSARGAVLPDQRRFVDDMRLIFAPLR
jgi:hypothetical protein